MWQQITDKQHWNTLTASVIHAQFLQSFEWGEFQKAVGRRVMRLSWKDQVLIQLIGMPLGFGKFYWYAPRGPIEIEPSEKRAALASLPEYLKKEGALFLRIDPLHADFWQQLSHGQGAAGPRYAGGFGEARGGYATQSIAAIQPHCVRIIDITVPKDEYYQKGIHTKTRYNIGLSERKGVEITNGEVNSFLNLNRETTARNKFVSHNPQYYATMVKTLGANRAQWKDCSIKVWEARYKGVLLASNLIIYFGDTMVYAHGASSSKHRAVMAPYLLRWRIIEDAITQGYKYHDLGGVNPPQDELGANKKHPAYKESWEGITQFKKGFGGNVHCYPASFDLIFSKSWYRVYRLTRKIRRASNPLPSREGE